MKDEKYYSEEELTNDIEHLKQATDKLERLEKLKEKISKLKN